MIAYEAATLRYYPDALSGEFAIVGLFMAERNPAGGYVALKFDFGTHTERLSKFFAAYYRRADWTLWRRAIVDNYRRLEKQYRDTAPLATIQESFEGLLNTISPHGNAAFRWSTPFLGAEESLEAAFEYWLDRLVKQNDVDDEEEYVTDDEFWSDQQPVVQETLRPAVSRNLVSFDRSFGADPEKFRMVWRNGHLNAMEVVSLTVRSAKTIRSKQLRTNGKLWGATRQVRDLACSVLVSPPSESGLTNAFARAKRDLADGPNVRAVLEPGDLPAFLAAVVKEAKPLE